MLTKKIMCCKRSDRQLLVSFICSKIRAHRKASIRQEYWKWSYAIGLTGSLLTAEHRSRAGLQQCCILQGSSGIRLASVGRKVAWSNLTACQHRREHISSQHATTTDTASPSGVAGSSSRQACAARRRRHTGCFIWGAVKDHCSRQDKRDTAAIRQRAHRGASRRIRPRGRCCCRRGRLVGSCRAHKA